MFTCTLCNEGLLSSRDILGTYCGHVFHRGCLDQHFSHTSGSCPSCKTPLRVDAASGKSGHAVLPLYPYFDNSNNTSSQEVDALTEQLEKQQLKINAVIQENVLLKRKLVEVFQVLIATQKESKSREHSFLDISLKASETESDSGRPDKSSRTRRKSPGFAKPYSQERPKPKNYVAKSPNKSAADDSSFVTATEHLDCMNSDLITLWSRPVVNPYSDEEKCRIWRSKRREYLTLRNKAQSWLSKMESASQRLIDAQQAFSKQVDYLQALKIFLNKIYRQGELIEVTKQAAVVYIILEYVTQEEKDEIHDKILSLNSCYSAMMTSITDHISRLENPIIQPQTTFAHSGESLERRKSSSVSTDISERCSSLSEEENSLEIPNVLSSRPRSLSLLAKRYFQLSQDDGDGFSSEAIFV